MLFDPIGHLSESILMYWVYTGKVKIVEFLVDFDPTGTPAGQVPQGRLLGLWRAFKRRMAKMNSGPKGSLLVGPGVAAAIRGQKTTIRGPKSGFKVQWTLIGVHFGVLGVHRKKVIFFD